MKNTMKKLILALGILGVSATSFAATRKQPPRPKRNIVKHENKKPAKRTAPKALKKVITKKSWHKTWTKKINYYKNPWEYWFSRVSFFFNDIKDYAIN